MWKTTLVKKNHFVEYDQLHDSEKKIFDLRKPIIDFLEKEKQQLNKKFQQIEIKISDSDLVNERVQNVEVMCLENKIIIKRSCLLEENVFISTLIYGFIAYYEKYKVSDVEELKKILINMLTNYFLIANKK